MQMKQNFFVSLLCFKYSWPSKNQDPVIMLPSCHSMSFYQGIFPNCSLGGFAALIFYFFPMRIDQVGLDDMNGESIKDRHLKVKTDQLDSYDRWMLSISWYE